MGHHKSAQNVFPVINTSRLHRSVLRCDLCFTLRQDKKKLLVYMAVMCEGSLQHTEAHFSGFSQVH